MKLCDLHTHSHFSDGTYSPTELVNEAEAKGLSAIVLCDHNTVDGLGEFLAAAEGKEVEAIGGVEFSTDYGEVELHIVGMFISPAHFEAVNGMVTELRRRKDESNITLIGNLRADGYEVDYDAIKATRDLETRLETANIINMEGNLIQTAYFEFTIPEAWLGKVKFEPSGSGYGYNLYYALGRTQEALQYGYQQSIFSIEIYDQQEDLEVIRSRKERFDILGEKDGFTYVLTQRTDSVLEFYSAAYHEEIRYMRRGYEFPQIIASFTLY